MKKRTGLPKETIEFQPDAVEVDERHLPFMARFALYAMVATIVLAVVWASLADVDKIVFARGKLVTQARPLLIQPIKTSMIKDIYVKAGDIVSKGQVLAELDTTFTQVEVQQLNIKIDSVRTRLARLERETGINGNAIKDGLQDRIYQERKQEYEAKLAAFQGKVEQLKASLITNQRDQEQALEQKSNAQKIDAMHAKLYKDGQKISHLAYLTAHKEYLDKSNTYDRLINTNQEIKEALQVAQADFSAYKSGYAAVTTQDLASSQKELADLLSQLEKAEHIHDLDTLKSPNDGIVLDVAKVSTGAVIKEAETLLTLVPIDKHLDAEIEVSSADIGKIQDQQTARIKLDAWPFQQYGTLKGYVKTISGDSFVTQASAQPTDGKNVGVVYRLKVGLADTNLHPTPAHYHLIPGMTVVVEINVGKRRVIRYFLDPLLKALDESIKEP